MSRPKGFIQPREHIAKRTASAMKTKALNGFYRPSGLEYKPWSKAAKINFRKIMAIRFDKIQKQNTIICCTCRKKKVKNKTQITNQKMHFCSQKCYIKFLKKNSVTDNGTLMRRSKEYTNWARRVMRRDKYACRACGIVNKKVRLNAHHIKSYAKFAQLRFITANGKTLCCSCHAKVHRWHEFRRPSEIRNGE